jgi:hypothetical protein
MRQIALFDQHDVDVTHREISGDPGAGGSTPDNEDRRFVNHSFIDTKGGNALYFTGIRGVTVKFRNAVWTPPGDRITLLDSAASRPFDRIGGDE